MTRHADHHIQGVHALSYVWPKDVVTLLPRTDSVGFMRLEHEPVMAVFDKVLDRVGHLMTPVDMYPLRYRVKEYPSDEDLVAIADTSK